MIRRIAIVGMAASLLVAFSLVASISPASAQYIPGQPGCIAIPTEIDENVSTTGELQCIGCPPSVPAEAFVLVDGDEVLIGSATVSDDPDGSVTIPVTYPALPSGDYTVLVRCGEVLLSNVLTVVDTGSDVVARLPVTGSDSSLLLQIALTLVVIGGLLALATRKRRHAYD